MEAGSLRTQSDWSYICRKFQGPGYLLVGDAACFIDPILSSGVHLAMDGAVKAALAINTFLREPELADQAMQWYEEEYQDNASELSADGRALVRRTSESTIMVWNREATDKSE